MELTARRFAPALFGMLAFLIIAACPCTARASSDDEDALCAKGGLWTGECLDR